MNIQLLQEPELQFGADRHVDIRFGLMNYGPLDYQSSVAPKRIRVGLVGNSASIEGIREWLLKCRNEIPAKDSNKPHLFPRFPGFTEDRTCYTELVLDAALERTLSTTDIQRLCRIPNSDVLVVETVNAFVLELQALAEKNATDVLVCAIPYELLEALDPSIAEGIEEVEEDEQSKVNEKSSTLDFHHLLKAKTMAIGQPIQIVLPSTYDPSKRRRQKGRLDRMRVLQDEATRAWNFHVALYYKAGGIPWRLIREPTDLETCFIGVSFYVTVDKQTVSTSIAQVFNERGLGVVVRGSNATIAKEDRQPHLDETAAFNLMEQALNRYRQEHKHLPARIVIHKTSAYNKAELDGFIQAIQSQKVDSCDFLHVQTSFKRLFRDGKYPPLRGTFLSLDGHRHILYTRGSVDFFATYPGLYVPRTLEMDCVQISQTPKFLAQEILALTKMNWNNTQFDGGLPITVRASRQVGRILKYVGTDESVQSRYSYYM
jgi:hypothetical protein